MKKLTVWVLVFLFMFSTILTGMVYADTGVTPEEAKLRSQFASAKKAYDDAVAKLNAAYAKNPGWYISGEIFLKEKGSYYVWGTAVPELGEPSSSHPGWLVDDGNIRILNPNPNNVDYQDYDGGPHYYIREETGRNMFGGKVRVFVYGGPPKEITSLQSKVSAALKNLNSAKSKLVSYINNNYLQRLKAQPNNSDIYKAYGDSLYDLYSVVYDKALIDQAIEKYKKAIQINPGNTNALLRLASIYMTQDKYNEQGIYDCFAKVAAKEPDTLVNFVKGKADSRIAGTVFWDLEKYPQVVATLQKAISAGDNTPKTAEDFAAATYATAQVLMDNKNYAKVIEMYNKSIEVLKHVSYETNTGMVDEETRLRIEVTKVEDYLFLGKAYNTSGNEAKAVEVFEEALEIHRTNMAGIQSFYIDTYNAGFYQQTDELETYLFNAYCKSGNGDKAGACFNDIFKNSEDQAACLEEFDKNAVNAYTHHVLGCALFNSEAYAEKYDEIYDQFKKAYDSDNSNAKYNNAMGAISFKKYDKTKNLDELQAARDFFEKAVKLDPDYKLAYVNLNITLQETLIMVDEAREDQALDGEMKMSCQKGDMKNMDSDDIYIKVDF